MRQPALWRYLENFTTYERFTNLIESVQFWFEPEPVISVINSYRPQITDGTLVIKRVLSKNKFVLVSLINGAVQHELKTTKKLEPDLLYDSEHK